MDSNTVYCRFNNRNYLLQSLHAVDLPVLIQYLPTLLNQLLRLLPNAASNDVSINAIRCQAS